MPVHRFHPQPSPLPSRERGLVVVLSCSPARTPPCGYCLEASIRSAPVTLWIDESPITLCQRVRFQRKGVNALSFSSRKRPAYAGMTVRDAEKAVRFCKGLLKGCRARLKI